MKKIIAGIAMLLMATGLVCCSGLGDTDVDCNTNSVASSKICPEGLVCNRQTSKCSNFVCELAEGCPDGYSCFGYPEGALCLKNK